MVCSPWTRWGSNRAPAWVFFNGWGRIKDLGIFEVGWVVLKLFFFLIGVVRLNLF